MKNGRVVIIWGILFAISTAFPIIASLVKPESFPPWVGLLDVGLAVVLVGLTFWLDRVGHGRITDPIIKTSYRFYRSLSILPLIFLALFFLAADGIQWHILLPGLAWRAWLLLYILPVLLAIGSGRSETLLQDNLEA